MAGETLREEQNGNFFSLIYESGYGFCREEQIHVRVCSLGTEAVNLTGDQAGSTHHECHLHRRWDGPAERHVVTRVGRFQLSRLMSDVSASVLFGVSHFHFPLVMIMMMLEPAVRAEAGEVAVTHWQNYTVEEWADPCHFRLFSPLIGMRMEDVTSWPNDK